jgi:hypothetical protein
LAIKDVGGDKIFKELFALNGKKLEVGFTEESGQDQINKAGWAQFGTKTATGGVHSPPRPFMSIAFEKNLPGLNKFITRQLKIMHNGDVKVKPFLDGIGKKHKLQIKKQIMSNTPPANKAATIRIKGHGQTLIHHKDMLGSVKWKIK